MCRRLEEFLHNHLEVESLFLKFCVFACCSPQSCGAPVPCVLMVSNYIIHILFISSKETSHHCTIHLFLYLLPAQNSILEE